MDRLAILSAAIIPAMSSVTLAMCGFGLAVFVTALIAAWKELVGTHGLDKIAVLGNAFLAVPLAAFGAEHLFGVRFVQAVVPKYMPWPLFWAYFVGVALVAAAVSIASKIGVRWSGLLLGIMMFLFMIMTTLPGLFRHPDNQLFWVLLLREPAFGGAGWILAGDAMHGWRGEGKGWLIAIGRVLIALAAIFYGVEHFLHPTVLPGVPLEKEMPGWIPGRMVIDYVTGAALLVGGGCILFNWKTRLAATALGSWILLLVLVIYGSVLTAALDDAKVAVQVEGLNYFFDTLLFAGAILVLARAVPHKVSR